MAESKKIQYCKDCGRIVDVGCACHLSFREKLKTVALTLPANFRAV